MDLSELGLTPEQLEAIEAHTAGLKKNNVELLDEKKRAQAKLIEEQEALSSASLSAFCSA